MESVIRRGRSSAGVALRTHTSESTQSPLESAPLPDELIVPLEAGLSVRDIRPVVKSGQHVLRGQPLVEGGGPLTMWTHASTSGVIRSLETRPVIHPRRREALCAVLKADGKDELWDGLAPPNPTQWDTAEKLNTALSHAGLAGLGGAVFPTGVKLAAAWRRPIREVIINGAECEPYITCDEMLIQTSPREVLAGALALVEITGAQRGIVAIEEDKSAALRALERELPTLGAADRLSIVTVPAIYPTGGERQLIQMLTGHEVPSLAHPTDIGYLCQNVGTAVALIRFLQTGQPLTSRITTVTGAGVTNPRNLEVRLGTPIAAVIEACGGYSAPVERLIMGGTMMGIELSDDSVPVTRATNCIIAATDSELRHDADIALPCIRCSECSRVCPAFLMPQELHRAAEHNQFASLENLGLFDCIECGCCDAVCPSRIRLTESFRAGKRSLVQAMDHDSRVQWFDAREQQRVERVRRWEEQYESNAATQTIQQPQRLEALADVVAKIGKSADTTDT